MRRGGCSSDWLRPPRPLGAFGCLRIKLAENIPADAAKSLRMTGHDVGTTRVMRGLPSQVGSRPYWALLAESLPAPLNGMELRIIWVEVATVTAQTDADVDAPVLVRNLGVGEVGDAVGAHALGQLERLSDGLGRLRRGGLAVVRQDVVAMVLSGLDTGLVRAYPREHALGIGLGEVGRPVGLHTVGEGQQLGLAGVWVCHRHSVPRPATRSGAAGRGRGATRGWGATRLRAGTL
jgi:hypothetical protein